MISVIIPIYNSAEFLEKCLESVLGQTYTDLEVLLIDDGSTDNSPQICDKFSAADKRVKVIHKKNGGVSSARNIGLKMATGEFVAFVDSDDYVEAEKYEKLISKQKESDADVVICNLNKIIDGKKYKVLETGTEQFCKTKDISMLLRHENLKKVDEETLQTSNNVNCYLMKFLVKRSALEGLWFDETVRYMEDVIFLTTLFLKDLKIDFLNDCLYNYVLQTQSISHGKIKNIVQKSIQFLESITPVLQSKNLESLVDAEKFYVYYMCVANFIKSGTKEDDFEKVKKYNTRKNYKSHKVLCNGKASKIKTFLVHYHLTFILKLANKLRG